MSRSHDSRSIAFTRFKVCCISSPEEAALAVRHGASALGLVSRMPSGPGVITDEDIARIASEVPPGVASFLLTSETEAEAIVEQQRRLGASVVQICDRLDGRRYDLLRKGIPGIGIVQVIHVTGEEAVEEAVGIAPLVDAILLDSGNHALAIKELGGTGRVHDWRLSRRIRDAISRPLFLAGGLNPSNAAEAIRQVRPYGLDICSGVRTDGKLDPVKLRAFAEAVRGA